MIQYLHCNFRYQPESIFGKSRANGAREGEVESELTESESHLNMLNKDGPLTLHSVFHPSLMPTEQTSTVVNMAVGVIGKFQVSTKSH